MRRLSWIPGATPGAVLGGAKIEDGAAIDDAPDADIRQNGVADMSPIHFNAGGVFHALTGGPLFVLPAAEYNESVLALERIASDPEAPDRSRALAVAGGVRFHFEP